MARKAVALTAFAPLSYAARVPSLARALLLATAFASAGSTAFAAESGFAFLRLPVSARASGLGESGVSFLESASALQYNPAGLADDAGAATSTAPWGVAGDAALSHHEAFGDLRQDAVIVRLGKGIEAFGAAFNTLYSEGIDEVDPVGNPTGTFGLSDFLVEGSYARSFGAGWRAGASLGYVSERVSSEKAGTWCARLGARWDPRSIAGLSLGVAVRNLGGEASFTVDGIEGESVSLPLTVQGGASYRHALGSASALRVAAEARQARDDDATGHLGAEFSWQSLALRAGARLGTDVGDFTAGLGVATGGFRLDYAFMPSGEDIGDSHRIELSAAFGL